jgi:hypothetical protein
MGLRVVKGQSIFLNIRSIPAKIVRRRTIKGCKAMDKWHGNAGGAYSCKITRVG